MAYRYKYRYGTSSPPLGSPQSRRISSITFYELSIYFDLLRENEKIIQQHSRIEARYLLYL
jgi:hypothetical protein